MRLEEILDMLGNETRREILHRLAERPWYVTELAQELEIGQKAIIEHLALMQQAGMLRAEVKRIEKGRPRKYFGITQDLILEIRIGHDLFDIARLKPGLDEEILSAFPGLRHITKRLEDVTKLHGAQKVRELELAYEELRAEEDKMNKAKKMIEYLMASIRGEMRSGESSEARLH